jgi:D-glycero-alpha-D-manno-heptose 1-phosphate guanylyltransferase
MKLLVLAGGLGTRLQGAVSGTPKALAPISGVPFLRLQIEHWVGQGVNSFVFLLCHQAEQIIDFLQREKNDSLAGCLMQYVIEPTPLGTGGAVAYAVDFLHIQGDFLITNADTWLSFGFENLMLHDSPAMLVLKVGDTGRYGTVIFDDNKCITTFVEKSIDKGEGWINAGLYLMSAELFSGWDHRAFSLEEVTLPKLAQMGIFKAAPVEAPFIDIGIPDDYFRFCHWVESKKIGNL